MQEVLIRNFTRKKIDGRYFDQVSKCTLKAAGWKKPVEMSVVIVGSKKIRTLNRSYRNIDRITDVLSFGNEERKSVKGGFVSPPDISYLGEIFICYPKAQTQARHKGHSLKMELGILLVHGILHLLGFDHEKDADYERMKKMEEEMLKCL